MNGLETPEEAAPTPISPQVSESIDSVLSSLRSYLNMDIAFLTEFTGDSRVFRNVKAIVPNDVVKVGATMPLSDGYCYKVVTGQLPELMADTGDVPLTRTIPETAAIPIGAHLCVPITVGDGDVFGTFCCFSHTPRPDLGPRDLDLMHTFARLISNHIVGDVEESRERVATLDLIREAVGDGDPHILFQPIYRLSDLKITSVEALSRFMSEPKRAPDLWFAEAEAAGMGPALELLAVRKAIAAAAALPADISVSVNISPRTLVTGEAGQSLTGIDPRRLVVEITEHTPIPDYEPLLAALKPLRELGIRIAIDDAGAGYSSLRHVLKLKPDIIKLDVSLTRDLDRDPMRHAMAAALAEFGAHTGTTIVAEGIETIEELRALRGLRIDRGQGFHLGHPQTAAAITAEYERNLTPDVEVAMVVAG